MIFIAYLDDGQEMSSYLDKSSKKVYLNNQEVKYSYNEGTILETQLPTINPNANIISTPVNVVKGLSIDFNQLIKATDITLAHF